MNKLKKKIFLVIFTILPLSILCFIIIFNITSYIEEKRLINNNLLLASDNKKNNSPVNGNPQEKEPPKQEEYIKYMDTIIYTILLTEDNQIKEIINHSNKEINNKELTNILKNITNSKNYSHKKIGFLYKDKYAYTFTKGNNLTIIDNTKTVLKLRRTLNISIFLYFIINLIIIIITKQITKWLTLPVETTFNKQKQFIADASHELKTPLSVIIASSEAMEKDKSFKWLNNIKEESGRMNNLISDLLDLASNEREDYPKLEEGNLSKIIELSVLTFEGLAYENNIKVKYNIRENIKIKMNENQIRQLIEILLDNAIKYANKQSPITVKQATLASKASDGVIIEGKNTITLEEVTLNDNNTKLNGKSTTYKNIFIYQSMSGDAEEGTASFTAKNSQITTNKGDTIYVTNTKAIITLENNRLINNDETGAFLRAQSDSLGNTNNNGGIVELTLNNQEIKGNIIIEKISTLDMELKNHSIFLEAINQENTAKNITLTISKDSKITLTADSYINTLNDEDQTFSKINFNGYKLYVNNKAIN